MTVSAMGKSNNSPNGVVILLALAICGAVAWMVVSGHAVTAHEGEMTAWGEASSAAVLTEITGFSNGDDGKCAEAVLAWCPNALVEKTGAANLGSPSPHFKFYCGKSSGSGIVAIIGTTRYSAGMSLLDVLRVINSGTLRPVYVTGYAINRQKFQNRLARDGCLSVDARWTVRILNMLLK